MRYQVHFVRNKFPKGKSKQKIVSNQIAGDFLNLEDAEFYSKMIEQDGAEDVKIVMK
jgi:hypothetical protein